jgi:diguanylate cyclase (GGDEF)-like protein
MSDELRADILKRKRRRQVRLGLRMLLLCTVAVGFWCLVWLMAGEISAEHWQRHAILPTAMLIATAVAAMWHERRWGRPGRELHEMLTNIRAGTAPIESLSLIKGPLAPIAGEAAEIVREGRSQKKVVAELHAEISQRIAGRTDALERQIGSLRQQATRDALTGLFNRRRLDQQLPVMIENARAHNGDLALLMIDVDHFKHLNDTLGHAAGDELLRSIAQIIRSSMREQDVAYRCGGDEFVVVMPECDAQTAHVVAARMQSLVDSLGRTLRVVTPPRLSIGISQLSSLGTASAEELLEKADAMLYRLKFEAKRSRKAAQSQTIAHAG